ncbi:hypothetical protein HTG_08860 [Natrinema mahii]|nr:hypothetical protein HTG_08860 [Natrinema mahii]
MNIKRRRLFQFGLANTLVVLQGCLGEICGNQDEEKAVITVNNLTEAAITVTLTAMGSDQNVLYEGQLRIKAGKGKRTPEFPGGVRSILYTVDETDHGVLDIPADSLGRRYSPTNHRISYSGDEMYSDYRK